MIGHRCKNCLWWDNRGAFIKFLPEIPGKPEPGFCRRRKAGAVQYQGAHVAIHPVHDAEEFCGEFSPDRED